MPTTADAAARPQPSTTTHHRSWNKQPAITAPARHLRSAYIVFSDATAPPPLVAACFCLWWAPPAGCRVPAAAINKPCAKRNGIRLRGNARRDEALMKASASLTVQVDDPGRRQRSIGCWRSRYFPQHLGILFLVEASAYICSSVDLSSSCTVNPTRDGSSFLSVVTTDGPSLIYGSYLIYASIGSVS